MHVCCVLCKMYVENAYISISTDDKMEHRLVQTKMIAAECKLKDESANEYWSRLRHVNVSACQKLQDTENR